MFQKPSSQDSNSNHSHTNQLILGDCLDVLKTLPDNSVDLCYIDLPFFSNRNYEVVWGDENESRSFQDRWSGGVDHYIDWLKERVIEIHRVLKPTGSFYLHCDWHADAYIRVYILDKIFGEKNFRNSIAWCYTAPANIKSKFPQKHDNIYFYTKSVNYNFDLSSLRIPYNVETVARTKRNVGKTGLYRDSKDAQSNHENRLNTDGKVPEDWWTDVPRLQGNASERLGYPTQKPEKLLERIIKASSNPGDVVLDCFMGGGTTIAVADRLGRKWIGIDQSVHAIKVSEMRLDKQQQALFNDVNEPYEPFTVQLHKYDYDTIRHSDAFAFERWIVEKFGGISNEKQRGDFGLDGSKEGIPLQVKRSDNVGRNVVDNFVSAIRRFDKNLFEKQKAKELEAGYIIAFSFGKGAIQEVARLKNEEGIIIKLVKVDEIVETVRKPLVKIEIVNKVKTKTGWQAEFRAVAKNDSKIEFYAWDWHEEPLENISKLASDLSNDLLNTTKFKFEPKTIRETKGIQIQEFRPGYYTIAVKAVDEHGIESIEILKFKVNGEVKILESEKVI